MHSTHWHDTLNRLAAQAALAPSSHNCQPWHLVGLCRQRHEEEMGPVPSVGATHTLLICIDRPRALNALPTLEREMRMSVGGFASLLANLLHIEGFGVTFQWLGADWVPATAKGRQRLGTAEPVMVLGLSSPPDHVAVKDHPLAQWIARRHTVRSPYSSVDEPPAASLRPDTCLPYRLSHGHCWTTVPRGPQLDRLAGFYRQHAAEDFRHGAAWRETYAHLHFGGTAQARASGWGSGMAIEALLGPLPAWHRRLVQLALHPRVLARLGPMGLHARIGRDFEQLVQHSTAVWALIQSNECSTKDDRLAHLLAGEAVIDSWLAATRDGLAMQPISVSLQHPSIERALRALLGVDAPVLFIARVGHPPAAPPVPRLRRATAAFCQFDFSLSSSAPTPAPFASC